MYSELQLSRAIKQAEQILRDPDTPPAERRATQQRLRDRRSRLAARQKAHQRKPTSAAELDSMSWTEYFDGYLAGNARLLEVLLRYGSVPNHLRDQAEAAVAESRHKDLLALCPAVVSKCSDKALQSKYEALVAEARRAQAGEAARKATASGKV